MKENNKIRGIFEGFTSGFLFKIVYLALVLISFNTFALDVPYLKTVFVALSVALGGIVLVYRLIHFKRFIKMKYIWILVAFLASYLLSLLLNLRYGFLEPIQAMVWMTFQYFILFLKDPARPCEKSQREFPCPFVDFLRLSVLLLRRQPGSAVFELYGTQFRTAAYQTGGTRMGPSLGRIYGSELCGCACGCCRFFGDLSGKMP